MGNMRIQLNVVAEDNPVVNRYAQLKIECETTKEKRVDYLLSLFPNNVRRQVTESHEDTKQTGYRRLPQEHSRYSQRRLDKPVDLVIQEAEQSEQETVEYRHDVGSDKNYNADLNR